jgi:nucleotide-binding universal stress UspA family protein
MLQKILVAFDDSENAARAVKYVAEMLKREHEITLFSVIPDIATLCEMNSPSLTPYFVSEQQTFCAIQDRKSQIVHETLLKARELLIDVGFDEENITIKVDIQKRGVARDILREAESGGYHMIVLGRRGLSRIEEFFLGSVSQKVIHSAKNLSVLVVN